MAALRDPPAQLETLGGNTHRICGEVRGRNQQLRSSLSPLFGADWSGAAAAQFASLYEDFDAHARGLADALDGIAGLLVRAGSSYAEVETQIAASFR